MSLPHLQRDALAALNGHIDRHEWRVVFDQTAHADFLDLLSHHPSAKAKIGPGVACFFKVPSLWIARPIVWIRRLDGIEDDFDLQRALSARSNPESPGLRASPFYRAARRAIEEQIEAARREGRLAAIAAGKPGLMQCSLTGGWHDERECQVDHDGPPFTTLLASWLIRRGLVIEKIRTDSEFPTPGRRFGVEGLTRDFARFHADNARLRLVWRTAHLARHCTPEGRKIALATLLAAGVDPLAASVTPDGGGRVLPMRPTPRPAPRLTGSLLRVPAPRSAAPMLARCSAG
ncbi:hypothetical protein [Acidiphilium acidophilum]|uniref:hypothetical protein n=1 Tax=Acidiphilium acidophilum TaxID=76588 RepID=UPI002E8E790C|nr:hypothetical protein [Acidiphilium acidophilum]